MGRKKDEKKAEKIKLAHPDRSGPDPSNETLLDLAEKRGLLNIPQSEREDGLDESGEPLVGRLGESVLWGVSLTMLHFTLDVLVANQYAVAIKWPALATRTMQAFPSKLASPFPTIDVNRSSHPPPLLLLPSSSLSADSPPNALTTT